MASAANSLKEPCVGPSPLHSRIDPDIVTGREYVRLILLLYIRLRISCATSTGELTSVVLFVEVLQ